MLQAIDIHKSYGSLEILKGINLQVETSEVVSIVGSSGAGKTTLLQILGTLDKPDAGSIVINGVAPFELSSRKLAAFRNNHIGFVFQFHQLLPEFTALENVCIPAIIQGTAMSDAKVKAQRLLDMLGLNQRYEHKPNELSGGEQQRVAVARSLMNDPSVIFADEPSGNLDTQNSKELHQLFFDLRDEFKQTFVIVTHNEILADMADRKIIMSDGSILKNGI